MLKHFSALLAAFLLCSISAYAQQQPLASARDYWNIPVSETIQRANDGDPFAQYTLAAMHNVGGNGPIHNPELFRFWREKSRVALEPLAAQGNAEAQYLLGNIYIRGPSGVPLNTTKGCSYYEQAAQQDHLEAQLALATIYKKNPYGINTDEKLASYWFKQALPALLKEAENNNPNMQYKLYLFYKIGHIDFEPDAQKAAYWQQRAMQSFRNELSLHQQVPIQFSTFIILSNYYREPDEHSHEPRNLIKAYTTASIAVERFSTPKVFRENVANLLAADNETLEHAQQLAEQCLKQLTDACY